MHCHSFLPNRTSTSAGEGMPPGRQNLNCTDFSSDVASRTIGRQEQGPEIGECFARPPRRNVRRPKAWQMRMAPRFAPAVRSFRSCPRVRATAAKANRHPLPKGSLGGFCCGLVQGGFRWLKKSLMSQALASPSRAVNGFRLNRFPTNFSQAMQSAVTWDRYPDFANGESTTMGTRKPWRVKSPAGSWES